MEKLYIKIISSSTLTAFFYLFSPFILLFLLFLMKQVIGMPQWLFFFIGGLLYPYLQIVLGIDFMLFIVKKLYVNYNINVHKTKEILKIENYSKLVFLILVVGLFVNLVLPIIIVIPDSLQQTISNYSYGFIVLQFYLLYTLIYSFWIITKTINIVFVKQGKRKKIFILYFFFLPLTFKLIYRKTQDAFNPSYSKNPFEWSDK